MPLRFVRAEFAASAVSRAAILLSLAFAGFAGWTPLAAQERPSIESFFGQPHPIEIARAGKVDRIAWVSYERGMRNVYTAAAPDFAPVRLTRFLDDDGVDLTTLRLSDDGEVIVFVRGAAPNRQGWVANPSSDPDGGRRSIWAVHVGGGDAWEIAEGAAPELSPDGRFVLYLRDGQIYRAPVSETPGSDPIDRGERPYITTWGTNSAPRWSPDGSKIAFVSNRRDHSFIAVYDVPTRTLDYLAPSVDFDTSPTWSPDGTRVAFIRRPGTPYGRQAQPGFGGLGNPPGPAARGLAAAREGAAEIPGLFDGILPGGHTLAFMVADVATGEAHEFWRNRVGETLFTNVQAITWAGESVIFPFNPPGDEWNRYFSARLDGSTTDPVLLTTTDGIIEGAFSITLSSDGRTLYYSTNADDIERRHIWAVPTSGGTPRPVTSGNGIETHPVVLASEDRVAFLYFDARRPASVGLAPTAGGSTELIFPTLPDDFPTDAHVDPEVIWTTAEDGTPVSNTLFVPADLGPGERRPALIFVHGGPIRQMLPGYHYGQFYHWAYGFNQWLASEGYVVLSINFRGGIGYGRSFQTAPGINRTGNAEYQDVLAGAYYLQDRDDVDPDRIGIWGLSYGGLLTAQALARNSDIFVAGVDLAGVHLYGESLDTTAVTYRSSAISEIANWRSPVLLVHGDDDRNVDFAQTIGLVHLLRAHGVYHELIVFPDDVHVSTLHHRWIHTWERTGAFLRRFVWDRETPP